MSEKNLLENEDPSWKMHMQMLMRRKKNMEIGQTIDKALHQYYVIERGQEVPQWRYMKDTDWWISYLTDQGIDPRNP
jgi:hypothetical protein